MQRAALGLELKVKLCTPCHHQQQQQQQRRWHVFFVARPEASCVYVVDEKEHWCNKLLQGEKQVELRRYAIPQEYLNQPVYLLQTPDGHEGQSTLPAEVMPAAHPGVCVAGTVVFSGQIRYSSYEQWLADADKHCVPPGTPYSWQQGITKEMFGWQIASVHAAAAPQPVPAMRRVLSSWFRVQGGDEPGCY